uniref:Putative mynd finger domaincontaining protein ovary overexpressed n=1 Tax=Rhipicephalus microplus TaxID=6941 RepID=A0A6M2D0D7_RHIMP
MRWITFDTSADGIFSRELRLEDSEFLRSHIDTFKCMWHEQTRIYWVRMIISLREYVKKHIFTSESLEGLGAPRQIFEMLVEYSYINICSSFTQETFGRAKEFLMAIIHVAANQNMSGSIGARPLSNDPFYNKFTRDSYRTVFGQPANVLRMKLQVYATAPLYSRFAAGVVAVLKQWIKATDCTLKHYYLNFTSNPYWSIPDDFCPQKPFFNYVEEYCFGWQNPDYDEVGEVMRKAPDRAAEFAEVVALLPSELMDIEEYMSDDCSEYSSCSDGEHGIKNWSSIMFAVSDHIMENCSFHISRQCSTCRAHGTFSDDSEPDDSDLDDVGDKNYMFWNRREVIAILQAAEKMFRERMLDKVLKAQIGEACTCEAQADGSTSDAPAPRKKKKSKKKPSVTLSTNVTSTGKRPQPTLMKNGADPLPPRSRAEVINLDEEDKASKLTAALEGLMLKIEGSGEATSTAQQPEKPQETPKPPQKASSSKAKSEPEQMPAPAKKVQVADKKSSTKAAPAAPKTAQRKCAKCGKNEDVKLKKCALCVQQKMDPVYYCSRECQTEDWDEHQTVHMEDLN